MSNKKTNKVKKDLPFLLKILKEFQIYSFTKQDTELYKNKAYFVFGVYIFMAIFVAINITRVLFNFNIVGGFLLMILVLFLMFILSFIGLIYFLFPYKEIIEINSKKTTNKRAL